MKKTILIAVTALLALAVASPAFANGSAGAGAAFGDHHATMAQTGALTGTMNPGVMHQGFSGWTGM